jgi:hypothetical protein
MLSSFAQMAYRSSAQAEREDANTGEYAIVLIKPKYSHGDPLLNGLGQAG